MKYSIALVALLVSLGAQAHGYDGHRGGYGRGVSPWWIPGAVVAGVVIDRALTPPPPPPPVYIYQAPPQAWRVPGVPVQISPEGIPYCPPGYVVIQTVNQYGAAVNVGCGR